MRLTESRRPDTDLVMQVAARAMNALTDATVGKAPEDSAGTTVETLTRLSDLIASLSAQLVTSKALQRDQTRALERIANLKIRSAAQLVEREDWKAVTAELQAIATDMLGRGGTQ
jgi:hypothetical protein